MTAAKKIVFLSILTIAFCLPIWYRIIRKRAGSPPGVSPSFLRTLTIEYNLMRLLKGGLKMTTFFLFFFIFFGALGILYPLSCAALYLVYKATGGRKSFRKWWKAMDF